MGRLASGAGARVSATLRIGSHGPAVVDLQRKLASYGIAADGDFGPLTEGAVRAFQAWAGLDVDGEVGPETLGALGLAGAAPDSAPATMPTGGRRGTLLLLGHVADATPFRAALAGLDVEARTFLVNGLSSAYRLFAARLRTAGRVLPALLRHAGAERPIEGYERIVFATWSAPYAMIEELLRSDADAAAITGWIALDSGYGTPPAGVVDLAARARMGLALYWAGHTDVPTSGYPSSGQYLAAVRARAGEPAGLFRVEHWVHSVEARRAAPDVGAFWRAEHVGALRRGPAFVRSALDALIASRGVAAALGSGETLGERALRFAVAELDAGVREEPSGSNDAPRIALYRSGAMRGERALNAGPGPWCAYAASWCAAQAGEGAPHGWRASVAELIRDARAVGAWHPAGDGYQPQRGDLACFGRAGESPVNGGKGHVGRVERVEGSTLVSVDANHGDRWARVYRPIDVALGWIAYPHARTEP